MDLLRAHTGREGFKRVLVTIFKVFLVSTKIPLAARSAYNFPILKIRNLLDVVLFVEKDEDCKVTCQNHPECVYYRFYEEGPQAKSAKAARAEGRTAASVENQPAQCFLYSQCTREVQEATTACPLTK